MKKHYTAIVCFSEKVCISCDFKACIIAVGLHKGGGDKGGLMDKVVVVFMRFGGGIEDFRVGFIIDKLGVAIDNKICKITMPCPPPRALQRIA